MDTPKPTLPLALIEKFRQTGIRLDRHGEFWHEGAIIGHQRFKSALLRWLDVLPDGRSIIRLDNARYAYIDVEDAHLLVLSLQWRTGSAWITLNDKSHQELAYHTLSQGSDNALYCLVRNSKLRARFTTSAYYELTKRLEEQSGNIVLRANGKTWPLPALSRSF